MVAVPLAGACPILSGQRPEAAIRQAGQPSVPDAEGVKAQAGAPAAASKAAQVAAAAAAPALQRQHVRLASTRTMGEGKRAIYDM